MSPPASPYLQQCLPRHRSFRITSRCYHDLAATDSSLLNVFTGGAALDLNLHQERGPLANLFSDLEVGAGRRLLASPGTTKPGSLTTYWNLRVPAPPAAPPSPLPPPPPSPPPLQSGAQTRSGMRGGRCDVCYAGVPCTA